MLVETTLFLGHDPNDPSVGFWIISTGTYDQDELLLINGGNASFSNTPDGDGNYHLQLWVNSVENNHQHPVIHDLNLGPLANPNGTAELVVDIMLGTAKVGGGIVKLADAEQTSRPLDKMII